MKTIEQVKAETKIGDVFTTVDFLNCVKHGGFIPYDGFGYLHDGKNETEICIWDNDVWNGKIDIKQFPYVIWFNK